MELISDEIREMIDRWLAANGGPRRFQPGDSVDFFAVQNWLLARGYVLSAEKGAFFIRRGEGAGKAAKWRDVIALVDTLRWSEGLETISVGSRTAALTSYSK